jgi:hypothetical protein
VSTEDGVHAESEPTREDGRSSEVESFAGTNPDAEPTFEVRDGEHVHKSELPTKPESGGTDTDRDREVWKTRCRECDQLVPAKPYCCEYGTERPADSGYHVAEEVGEVDGRR